MVQEREGPGKLPRGAAPSPLGWMGALDGYSIAQLVHVLAASIWIGGHLVIALGYLPRLLRGDTESLEEFESVYERIAVPSLLLAVVAGVYMGLRWAPSPGAWLQGRTAALGLMLDARLRLVPRLRRDPAAARALPPT